MRRCSGGKSVVVGSGVVGAGVVGAGVVGAGVVGAGVTGAGVVTDGPWGWNRAAPATSWAKKVVTVGTANPAAAKRRRKARRSKVRE